MKKLIFTLLSIISCTIFAQEKFTCTNNSILYQVKGADITSQSFISFNNQNQSNDIINNNVPGSINAIGYNIEDDYIYGIELNTNNLYRLDATGTKTFIATISGLPANTAYVTGDFDFDGNLYVTGGSLNILVEWNNNAVIADLVTGTGNVSFNKSESFPTQAKVTLFPGAGDKPSFTLNLNCPVGDELTVKEIVINFNGDVSLTTTCRYRWQLSNTLSPYSTNSVVLENDGVSLFTEQTGTSSFGTIPALGSTVIMQNRQNSGQTFEFDANSDKFKYLTTNVDYNEVDLNTLIPLLNTATPITGSFPEYQASFTYSTQATYMYLVWDLRESDLLQFCYDSSTPEEACCECD